METAPIRALTLTLLGVGFLFGAAANAAPDRVLPYSGTLDEDEVPAEGVYSIQFDLYFDGSGNTPLFSESQEVTVVGGAFSVVLGEEPGNPLPDALYLAGAPELAVTVDSQPLAGRQRLLPTAFATDAQRGQAFRSTDSLTVTGGGETDEGVFARLDRDGSAGKTPQAWDVAVDSDGALALRDQTNGMVIPLRVAAGAQGDSVVLAAGGGVGIGTASPQHLLHVVGGDAPRYLVLENTDSAESNLVMMQLINTGPTTLRISNTLLSEPWDLTALNSGNFMINRAGAAGAELQVTPDGDLIMFGDVFSNTCPSPGTPCAPDYVFADDYPLMPLAEVERFVEKERHLPGVPSATELTGPRSLGAMQMKLLEKVEELTLHTIRQQKEIESLRAELAQMRSEAR